VVHIFGINLLGGIPRSFGVMSDLISTSAPAFERTSDSLALKFDECRAFKALKWMAPLRVVMPIDSVAEIS
jgi:hypothetical protein